MAQRFRTLALTMSAKTNLSSTRALLFDIKNTLSAIEEGQRRLEAFVKEQLERIDDRLEQRQPHQASCDSLINTTPAEEDDSNENDEPGTTRDIMRPQFIDNVGRVTRTAVGQRHIMELICRSPFVRSETGRLNAYSMLTEEARRQLRR